jgi:predicted anti-sigma-YlaC factor YlaD
MNNKCPFSEKLSLYIDGELTNEASERIRRHLQSCSACENELNRFQSVNQMLDEIKKIEPSPDFERAFWRKINSIKEKKKKKWSLKDFGLWRLRPILAGATVVATIAMVAMLYVEKGASKWNPEDLAISKDLQFYSDLDIVSHLDMLENWDEIKSIRELN